MRGVTGLVRSLISSSFLTWARGTAQYQSFHLQLFIYPWSLCQALSRIWAIHIQVVSIGDRKKGSCPFDFGFEHLPCLGFFNLVPDIDRIVSDDLFPLVSFRIAWSLFPFRFLVMLYFNTLLSTL